MPLRGRDPTGVEVPAAAVPVGSAEATSAEIMVACTGALESSELPFACAVAVVAAARAGEGEVAAAAAGDAAGRVARVREPARPAALSLEGSVDKFAPCEPDRGRRGPLVDERIGLPVCALVSSAGELLLRGTLNESRSRSRSLVEGRCESDLAAAPPWLYRLNIRPRALPLPLPVWEVEVLVVVMLNCGFLSRIGEVFLVCSEMREGRLATTSDVEPAR